MRKTHFRIIPRIAHYPAYGDTAPSLADTEPLLFLPDLPANEGKVTCYARVGEHGEADIEFYRMNTSPPDSRARELCDWYIKNRCGEDFTAKIQKSFRTVAR
jgi:dienelactone hydrolase